MPDIYFPTPEASEVHSLSGYSIPRVAMYLRIAAQTGGSYAWFPEPRRVQRERAAAQFADRVREVAGVREVRLLNAAPELEVAIVLETANLELELRLRGCFVDIMRRELDVSEGELFVYAADDQIPGYISEAQALAG
jgi:hypothetical protein